MRRGAPDEPAAVGVWLPDALGGAVVAIAASVLLGWALDVAALTFVVEGFEATRPWTAVALGLLGLAVARGWDRQRIVPALLAGAGGAVAIVMGVEYLLGVRSGFDQLLFDAELRELGGRVPGRMAPMTAWCITLSGAALVLRATGHRRAAYNVATVSLVTATVALLGYLCGVESLRRVGPYASVALPTSVSLVALNAAVLHELGCDCGQGYLLAHPTPAPELEASLPAIASQLGKY